MNRAAAHEAFSESVVPTSPAAAGRRARPRERGGGGLTDCPQSGTGDRRPAAADARRTALLDAVIAGAALSWPRRAGGDVSILAAAAGSDRRSGSSGGRASAVAPETRTPPPKPRTGPRPPSSSPTGREGRCRPGRGDPVGARLAGGLGQLGVALPLSPPGAAPLAPGGEPPARGRGVALRRGQRERGRFRPSGPAQPWSHAVADAPRARSGSAGSRTFASPASRNRRRSLSPALWSSASGAFRNANVNDTSTCRGRRPLAAVPATLPSAAGDGPPIDRSRTRRSSRIAPGRGVGGTQPPRPRASAAELVAGVARRSTSDQVQAGPGRTSTDATPSPPSGGAPVNGG